MNTAETEKSTVVNIATVNLGIVCPMANEKDSAEKFVSEVLSYCKGFRSVTMFPVLDNVSKDGTVAILKEMEKREPRLRMVWAPENRCVVDAYVRGYREALKAGCDWILEIDAGYSHQPSDIPKFIEEMKNGYDCVFGSRFSPGSQYTDRPIKRYVVSRGGSLMINLLLGTRQDDMTSGFELFSAKALKNVLDKGINSKGHFFQSEIKVHCRNLKIKEVPIHYTNPSNSVSNKVLKDAFSNLWRLFNMRLQGTL